MSWEFPGCRVVRTWCFQSLAAWHKKTTQKRAKTLSCSQLSMKKRTGSSSGVSSFPWTDSYAEQGNPCKVRVKQLIFFSTYGKFFSMEFCQTLLKNPNALKRRFPLLTCFCYLQGLWQVRSAWLPPKKAPCSVNSLPACLLWVCISSSL